MNANGIVLGHVTKLLNIPDNVHLESTVLKNLTAKDGDYWLIHIEIGQENKTLVFGKIVLPRFEGKPYTGECICVSLAITDYGSIFGDITYNIPREVRCSKVPGEDEINNLTQYFGWPSEPDTIK